MCPLSGHHRKIQIIIRFKNPASLLSVLDFVIEFMFSSLKCFQYHSPAGSRKALLTCVRLTWRWLPALKFKQHPRRGSCHRDKPLQRCHRELGISTCHLRPLCWDLRVSPSVVFARRLSLFSDPPGELRLAAAASERRLSVLEVLFAVAPWRRFTLPCPPGRPTV